MIKLKYLFILSLISLFSVCAQAQISKPKNNIPAAQYYTGGQDSMYAFIQRHVKYPMIAKRNRIQGECIIKFVIDADGTAKGFQVVKNVGGGLGEEAARVVSLLKFTSPGYKFQTSIPVIFKL